MSRQVHHAHMAAQQLQKAAGGAWQAATGLWRRTAGDGAGWWGGGGASLQAGGGADDGARDGQRGEGDGRERRWTET